MNYPALLSAITEAHQQAQVSAASAVNRHLILRNWLIGAHLVEFEQCGEDRAKYGDRLLLRLATDLQQKGIAGCSRPSLQRMRHFYLLYPQLRSEIRSPLVSISDQDQTKRMSGISSPPVAKSAAPADKRLPRPLSPENLFRLSWTHLIDLLAINDPWKRAFYENECLKGNWSKRQLQRQIGSLLYERTGLSTDKHAVIEHARQQAAAAPMDVASLIRDPYVLEFTGLAEKPRYRESDLETALLDHLQSFLLELGTGFCFEARQKCITVGNEHDYLDLVFYHRVLRCHLLIDLKVRPFRHGDAGQMNFYLNYWKAEMMAEGDQPPVGLLLCSDKEGTKVEYATAGLDHQLFVSRYLVSLPQPDQLQALIENDRAAWAQHHAKAAPKPKRKTKS